MNRSPPKKKRVLVVDDEVDVAQLTCEMLDKAGFNTASAGSCAEALQQMEKTPADLLLLDIELPDGSGLNFLGKFRELHPKVPVVMLTGLGYDEALMKTALEHGAAGYVSKGVEVENVIATIKRLTR